jgi:hypothetical protein
MKKPGRPVPDILSSLQADLEQLASAAASQPPSSHLRKRIDDALRALTNRIDGLLRDLDPIRHPTSVFDPANPKIIGRFIALALVAQPRHNLAAVERFYGSGVYAIYYRGGFNLYQPIANAETPIYVGKAGPALPNARTPLEQSDRLARRLEDHRKNIGKATSTLSIGDFECRFLVVQSGYETAAEDYLIHLFQPIWNSETNILFGLGKHGDDAGTRANKRSPWDTLHPGREWAAASIEDARTRAQIKADLARHFGESKIFKTINQVVAEFIAELRQI